jgi:FtsH-binding integral membrane protein
MNRTGNYDPNIGTWGSAAAASQDQRSAFISKVYGLLTVTILFAAGSSALAMGGPLTPVAMWIAGHPILTLIAYFGLAVAAQGFSANNTLAVPLLLAFGSFTGLMITPLVAVLLQTQPHVVTQAFVATGGIFAVMSILGAVTKRDLSGLRGFLLPGLILVIVLSLVNLFVFQSSLAATAISAVTILIFCGYIAYDTQNVMQRYPLNRPAGAALSLYLNVFIVFVNLLQILSSRD